ncbi:MAG: hypothetical protein AAGE03_05540 [Pseudomonadota bacterium]
MDVAAAIIFGTEIWMGIGALVAVVFLIWGIDQIDEDAQGAYVFRPLLIPGILLIWPLVLWRWSVLTQGRDAEQTRYRPNRRIHGRIALAMPVVLGLVIVVGLSARQQWPGDIAPVQLADP